MARPASRGRASSYEGVGLVVNPAIVVGVTALGAGGTVPSRLRREQTRRKCLQNAAAGPIMCGVGWAL